MFDRKEFLWEKIEALVEACEPLGRGDILTNETIQRILGVKPHTEHWQHCLRTLEREMEERRGISFLTERGVGKRLCTKDQQLVERPRRLRRSAIRKLGRALRGVNALPNVGLSSHQRRLKSFQAESLAAERAAIRGDIQRESILSRRTETNRQPWPSSSACALGSLPRAAGDRQHAPSL